MLLGDLTPPKRIFPCRVRELYETLEKADSDIMRQAVNNLESWPAKTLSNALRERDVIVSDLAITKHRNNRCSCGDLTNA